MTVVDFCDLRLRLQLGVVFQSLLLWMTVVDLPMSTTTNPFVYKFQSLLLWMTVVDSLPSR